MSRMFVMHLQRFSFSNEGMSESELGIMPVKSLPSVRKEESI